jgi:mycoredoxin-dependent peroxiredoxin
VVAAAGVGAQAPDFALRDQHGVEVCLGDLRAASSVVLIFFPFAFTAVCTGELRALRERLPELTADGAVILGISCDPMFALRVFAEQEQLPFPLLSDFWPHGAVARAYSVFDEERGCAVRGTFVVDRAGTVRWRVVNAVPDPRDVDALGTALAELRS